MAGENKHVIKFWRGSRQDYNLLGAQGKLDFWTRYSVKETDGRRNEYFGARPVTEATGELYPVLDIVSSLPENFNVGDRYLVGHDAIYSGNTKIEDAEYYVVEIAADLSRSTVNPLGKHCVRVASRNYWTYQIVDDKLVSYTQYINCGTY